MVNVRRVVQSKIDIDTLLRMDYLILNWVCENMLVPGKVETWNIIQDSNGMGVTQMPIHIIKTMASKLSIYYAHRIEKSFAINVPYAMNTIWKIVKVFIDAETRKKIIIQRSGWEPLLAENISPENLEEKYGGILPDKESNFHPFLTS